MASLSDPNGKPAQAWLQSTGDLSDPRDQHLTQGHPPAVKGLWFRAQQQR